MHYTEVFRELQDAFNSMECTVLGMKRMQYSTPRSPRNYDPFVLTLEKNLELIKTSLKYNLQEEDSEILDNKLRVINLVLKKSKIILDRYAKSDYKDEMLEQLNIGLAKLNEFEKANRISLSNDKLEIVELLKQIIQKLEDQS